MDGAQTYGVGAEISKGVAVEMKGRRPYLNIS